MIFTENYKDSAKARIQDTKGKKKESLQRIHNMELAMERIILEENATYHEALNALSNITLEINKMGTRFISQTELIKMKSE